MKRRAVLAEFPNAAVMIGLATLVASKALKNPLSSFSGDFEGNSALSPDPPHMDIDAVAIRTAFTAKVDKDFPFAQAAGLIPVMESVCQATGMPLLDLMSLTCFESDMNRSVEVKTAKGSRHQTAFGIVQIEDPIFLYLVEKHLIKQPAQSLREDINESGGDLGRKLLKVLSDVKEKVVMESEGLFRRAALLSLFKRKSSVDHLTADKRVISNEMVAVLKNNPGVEKQILLSRGSPFVSMLLVSKDLMEISADINPYLSRQLAGASFRMLHMFGLDQTNNMLDLYKKAPSTKMATAFGLEGVPLDDQRWFILINNRINPHMRIDDFIRKSEIEYSTVRTELAKHYAAYQSAPVTRPEIPAAPAVTKNKLFRRHHKKLHR